MSKTVANRLAELSTEHRLPPGAERQLAELVALVAEDPHAPTTIREPARVVELHVADSLDGMRVPGIAEAVRLADIGSGAGFPGLVLAIARPEMAVTLIESAAPKARFLAAALDRLDLSNVTVAHSRVEAWAGTYEAVTARAVAPLVVLVEYAAPLLAIDGTFVAWKGAPERPEEEAGDGAGAIVGLERSQRLDLEPRPGAERRSLYVYSKVRNTPDRFPRRPGMARKRPLSG